ncbi:MAG TPA: rhodanese [Clostridiales bacterium UBA8960]|nr:rhodanese [Clostridiales bacterium UBA8960]
MEILLAITAAYIVLVIINKATAPKVENISGRDLDTLIRDKSIKRHFVDVRTPSEFSGRKVKGFMNIPLDQLNKRASELHADNTVVLMCASGSRSLRAARILSKNGFKKIVNVKGGISSYPSK